MLGKLYIQLIQKLSKEVLLMAKKQKKEKPGEMLFLAGLFGGLGFGYVYGNVVAGLFIGMAAGFLAAFAYTIQAKKK